jgi:hypothetical protein
VLLVEDGCWGEYVRFQYHYFLIFIFLKLNTYSFVLSLVQTYDCCMHKHIFCFCVCIQLCMRDTSLLQLRLPTLCSQYHREGQIHALDRVQKKADKFAYRMSESNWETLSQRRKIARICALFKAYFGERGWKFICDRLQRPNYLSRIDHDWKIRNRRQRTDIGKYSFVNRTIRLWNRLPAEILGTLPCKPRAFRKGVRKVINVVN